MNLESQISTELQQLAGSSAPGPRTLSLTSDAGVQLAIDFAAVDSVGCAFRELRLSVPWLAAAGFESLVDWANALCRRITYLLENIGPLEKAVDAGRVLIRSTPPHRRDNATQFYEIVLERSAAGTFMLRRYRSERGGAGRVQVDLHTTHEVLVRLVGDLEATLPAARS